jgi:hypothetical protein
MSSRRILQLRFCDDRFLLIYTAGNVMQRLTGLRNMISCCWTFL